MEYLEEVIALLTRVKDEQAQAIALAAQACADAILKDHLVYVFGASHAGILAQELFYRAGGLVPVCPLLPPGLMVDARPVTLTTRFERLPGFGAAVLSESPVGAGDVLIVHSVSGRNPAAVEIAEGARERGAFVIGLTSLAYSRSVAPRGGSKRLFEVVDLALDNLAPPGDALADLPGTDQRVGPASTVVGAGILNAVIVQTARLLQERTGDAPVFMSANLDGGDEHNQRWLEHYKGRLTYL